MPASRARRDGGYGAFGAHAFGDFGRLHCLRARRAHLLFPMTMDNAAQRQRYARIMRQQAAIVGLARGAPEGSALRSVVESITRRAATTMETARASAWLLSDSRRELTCLSLYELDREAHSSGIVLHADSYPRYFAALETGRAIAADNVFVDPRTNEFTEGYLVPLGITSMLDAAVRIEGRVAGVVCLEHIGPKRTWTVDEISFAGALADQIALALAAEERRCLSAEAEKLRHGLLHAQKLESLGLMAGGIAHDFNNLLTVITANLTFVDGRLTGDVPEVREAVSDALAAAGRSAGLTRQLLAYAGKGHVAVAPCDVNREVVELARMLHASVPKNVTVALELGEDLPAIEGDATQLQQLVMNLALNAAEAMGTSQGCVTIRTRTCELAGAPQSGRYFDYGLEGGQVMALEVIDDGPGMSEEVLSRVFDPFFSTKGSGRGLGLASVIGIVRNHHGALEVVSEVGRGTAFRAYFATTSESARVSGERLSSLPRGQGTVLVIDDEVAITRAARVILEQAGFSVLVAADPDVGLDLCKQHASEIGAVLLDVAMPKKTGIEVMSEVRAVAPHVSIVFTSGNPVDVDGLRHRLEEDEHVDFLAKPFGAGELLTAMTRALRRPH